LRERQLKTGWVERATAHALTVRLVDGRREERSVQRFEHLQTVHVGLLDEREDLAQRLEHAKEQEVSRELHQVRPARILAHARDPPAQGLEHWHTRLHRVGGPRGNHPQLPLPGHLRPPEHGRGDVAGATPAVRVGEPTRSGSIVLIARWIAPSPRTARRPRSPKTTSSNARSSDTSEMTIRARSAAVAGE